MRNMGTVEGQELQHLSFYGEPIRQEVTLTRKIKKQMKNRKRAENLVKSDKSFARDIISSILSKVPPELLLHKFRFICKLWDEIISKELEPNPLASDQYILQTLRRKNYYSHIVEMRGGKLVRTRSDFPHRMGEIRDSCKGLLLYKDLQNGSILHVTNLLTNKEITLPECPSGCSHVMCSCSLTVDTSSKVIKVVHLFHDQYGYEILSVGIDEKWRTLPGPYAMENPRNPRLDRIYWENPVRVKNILHWRKSVQYIVSFDARDEKSQRTLLPTLSSTGDILPCPFELLEMGGFLSAFLRISNTQLDIWILEDFTSVIWIKRHSIISSLIVTDAKLTPDLSTLLPLVSLRNGEEILLWKPVSKCFSVSYSYEINDRRMRKLKMNHKPSTHDLLPYDKTFICWDSELSRP